MHLKRVIQIIRRTCQDRQRIKAQACIPGFDGFSAGINPAAALRQAQGTGDERSTETFDELSRVAHAEVLSNRDLLLSAARFHLGVIHLG